MIGAAFPWRGDAFIGVCFSLIPWAATHSNLTRWEILGCPTLHMLRGDLRFTVGFALFRLL